MADRLCQKVPLAARRRVAKGGFRIWMLDKFGAVQARL